MFDSGIRSGSDILKALALGAKAVCIGRGARWGLAAYGAAGVTRIHEILQGELVMAMAQTGTAYSGFHRSHIGEDKFPYEKKKINRRKALAGLGSLPRCWLGVADNYSNQNWRTQSNRGAAGRIAPREDLANVLEFEDMAARRLPARAYALIAGGDRSYFERITFRPRMMVPYR